MGSIVPFVLEGICAYKLTSLLEGDEGGRSGRAGPETRRAGMKTDGGLPAVDGRSSCYDVCRVNNSLGTVERAGDVFSCLYGHVSTVL